MTGRPVVKRVRACRRCGRPIWFGMLWSLCPFDADPDPAGRFVLTGVMSTKHKGIPHVDGNPIASGPRYSIHRCPP